MVSVSFLPNLIVFLCLPFIRRYQIDTLSYSTIQRMNHKHKSWLHTSHPKKEIIISSCTSTMCLLWAKDPFWFLCLVHLYLIPARIWIKVFFFFFFSKTLSSVIVPSAEMKHTVSDICGTGEWVDKQICGKISNYLILRLPQCGHFYSAIVVSKLAWT